MQTLQVCRNGRGDKRPEFRCAKILVHRSLHLSFQLICEPCSRERQIGGRKSYYCLAFRLDSPVLEIQQCSSWGHHCKKVQCQRQICWARHTAFRSPAFTSSSEVVNQDGTITENIKPSTTWIKCGCSIFF